MWFAVFSKWICVVIRVLKNLRKKLELYWDQQVYYVALQSDIFFFLFPFISLKTTKPFLFMIYFISCRANSDLNTTAPTTRSRFQKVNIWLECLVNFGPILSITTNNLTRSYWTNKRPNNMSNSSMMILFASH